MMKLYKDKHSNFWLRTNMGWWCYTNKPDFDGSYTWCWRGADECNYDPYPSSTPLEFLLLTGKNIHGMIMIQWDGGGRNMVRKEFIKLK